MQPLLELASLTPLSTTLTGLEVFPRQANGPHAPPTGNVAPPTPTGWPPLSPWSRFSHWRLKVVWTGLQKSAVSRSGAVLSGQSWAVPDVPISTVPVVPVTERVLSGSRLKPAGATVSVTV